MMKKIIRAISLLLALLMLGSTMTWAAEPAVEDDIPPAELLAEEYNPAKYEHAFEPGQVGVTLKKSVTITEGYEALFPELNIVSVRRIGAEAYDMGKMERQIILLYLEEQTRESVLNAIELLKSNPYVYYSTPNYQFGLAGDDPEPEPEPAIEDDIPPADVLASVYDPAKYEHAFAPGEVGVTLKKSVTITEGYEALFPELNIVSVRRIGAMVYDAGEMERQLIVLYLEVQTRESVLNAIELLKSNPYVYYAKPNYQYGLADGDPDPEPTEPVYDTPADLSEYAPGDVTFDGAVDNRDLIMVARFLVSLVQFDGNRILLADFNGDGAINNTDLIEIAKYVVKTL